MGTNRNLLECTITNTPGTAGNFVVGPALARRLGFTAADDGKSFEVSAEDTAGIEVRSGCVYTHAALTLTRATLESSSTGAAINLTSATVLRQVFSAARGNAMEAALTGSVTPRSVAFSTAVPLDATMTVMAATSITGATAFTVGSTVPGGSAIVRLTANGTNIPTFSGMAEWGTSQGWVNTAGYINTVQFWNDGTSTYYSISQPAAQPDTTAPTVSSRIISNASPTQIAITYNEALDPASVPATSAYTVSGKTVSAVAVSGAVVTVTVSAAFISSDTPTISYTAPGTGKVRDLAGNNAANFTTQSITNNVASSAGFMRLTNLSDVTESGDGTVGYTYTTIGGGTGSGGAGTVGFPTGTDGYFAYRLPAAWVFGTNIIPLSGLRATQGMDAGAAGYVCAVYASVGQTGFDFGFGGGGSRTDQFSPTHAASNWYRHRVVGTTVYLEVSADNQASWTTCSTWTGVSRAAKLWPIIGSFNSGANNAVRTPYQSGLV